MRIAALEDLEWVKVRGREVQNEAVWKPRWEVIENDRGYRFDFMMNLDLEVLGREAERRKKRVFIVW